jgi:hypothetical protein
MSLHRYQKSLLEKKMNQRLFDHKNAITRRFPSSPCYNVLLSVPEKKSQTPLPTSCMIYIYPKSCMPRLEKMTSAFSSRNNGKETISLPYCLFGEKTKKIFFKESL